MLHLSLAEHRNRIAVYPVILNKEAKVIDRPDLQDSNELDDIIEQLWNDGVDAVRLGDWSDPYSEQELAILNPYAISTWSDSQSARVYGSKRSDFTERTDEELEQVIDQAKEAIVKFKQWESENKLDKWETSEWPENITPEQLLERKQNLENRKKARAEYNSLKRSEQYNIARDIKLMRKPNGEVYGFVKDGVVYLNRDKMNLNTPIHEFGHLFTPIIKAEYREFYDKGVELIKESQYYEDVKNDPNYSHLDEDGIIDEAINQAIGDKGAKIVKDKGLFDRLKDWIKGVWERIGAKFGIKNLTSEQIQDLMLNDWTDIVNSELLNGEKLTTKIDVTKTPTIEIDGVERSTTNSEGRPIHSTEEGVRRWNSGAHPKETVESAIAKYKDGDSTRKIASELSVARASVTKWISDAGISRTSSTARGGGYDIELKSVELYKTGIGANEIAKQLGVTSTAIYRWLNKHGIKIRTTSEAQSLRAQQGRQPIRGIRSVVKTKFGEIRADSVYEAARILQLENNKEVTNVYRYSGAIDYGENRKYTPDLVVEYSSGLTTVEEIKPLFQVDRDDIIEKANAARLKLGDDISYKFITQNDIDFNLSNQDEKTYFFITRRIRSI